MQVPGVEQASLDLLAHRARVGCRRYDGLMDGPTDENREWRMRWSLGTLHFLVIAAFTWARIVRDGALLSRVSVEWVPWLTAAVLVATGVATPLIARATRHLTAVRAFARVAIATGVSLLVWELLLRTKSEWSALALYVWVGAYGPLLVAQFWILVHQSLDAEQARAHIGWVGACGILGGVASGLVATLVTRAVGRDDLLGLTALAQLGAGALALGQTALAANGPGLGTGNRDAAPAVANGGGRRARTVLREAGYARLLALVVVLGALTGGLVDYQFKAALQRQSTDAAELTRWLGLFNVAASGLALCAQIATGMLLARFGSRALAFVLPAGVMASASAGLALPMVWPAVLARLWETAARHSLARTANEFFFLPFQGAPRSTMKHAAEGFLTRGGEVGASMILVGLSLAGRADPWHLSLAVVVACAGWMASLGWLGRAYAPALSRSLDALLRPGRTPPTPVVDRGVAIPELVKLLRSRDPRHIVFALDELSAIDPARARQEARPLLAHEASAVRARARRENTPHRHARVAATLDSWPGAGALHTALRSGDAARATAACVEVVAARERHAVPVLLSSLTGDVRDLVRNTLVQLGDDVAGTLGDTLADERVPLRVRRDVAIVLGRMATQAALAQLWRVPRTAPRGLRLLALRGLGAARKAAIPLAVDESDVRRDLHLDLQQLERRREQASQLGADAGPEIGLLARALDEAAASARELLFRRLALIYPAREMMRAHRGISSGDDRIRAFALEYLEATLTPVDRDRLLPALRGGEATPPASTQSLVETLAMDQDVWIATLAVHALGTWRAASLRAIVAAPVTQDAIYQETARWALARL